ncbi:MAG: hypothetical protein AAGC47_01995 [Bacteroidota bacterium]
MNIMKGLAVALIAFFLVNFTEAQDSEKRIKFDSGTIKLCTQANLKISGYNGDEVIIKSLNKKTRYTYNFDELNELTEGVIGISDEVRLFDSGEVEGFQYLAFTGEEKKLEKGLEPLGEDPKDDTDDLFLDITEKPGELIIKDYQPNSSQDIFCVWAFDNEYEIMVPNSVKLLWNTDNCSKKNSNSFFISSGGDPSELKDFSGETEISFTYGSISLTDVTGPVIANTIGGNINVEFDDELPTKLYSLITENGYINIEMPAEASLDIDAKGQKVLSDMDFEVTSQETDRFSNSKKMNLKLNSGKVKMKLDAGYGKIYLREN